MSGQDKNRDREKEEKLIHSYYAYKLYVKLNNINAYKAGTYKLNKTYNLNITSDDEADAIGIGHSYINKLDNEINWE